MKWVAFSVLVGIVPLGFTYVRAWLFGPGITLQLLAAQGGVFLVAVGLTAGAIGDLIASKAGVSYKLAVGGLCSITLLMSTLLYADVSDVYTQAQRKGVAIENAEMDIYGVYVASLILYFAALLGSGACVIRSGADHVER